MDTTLTPHETLEQEFAGIERVAHHVRITFGDLTFPVVVCLADHTRSTVDIASLPIPLYGTRDECLRAILPYTDMVGYIAIRVGDDALRMYDVVSRKAIVLTYEGGKLAQIEKVVK